MSKLDGQQIITVINWVFPNDSCLYKTCDNYFGFYLGADTVEDDDNEFAHQEVNETFGDFIFRVVCLLIDLGNKNAKKLKNEGNTEFWDYAHASEVEINAAIHLPTVNFKMNLPKQQSC